LALSDAAEASWLACIWILLIRINGGINGTAAHPPSTKAEHRTHNKLGPCVKEHQPSLHDPPVPNLKHIYRRNLAGAVHSVATIIVDASLIEFISHAAPPSSHRLSYRHVA